MRASSILLTLALACLAGCDASPTATTTRPPPPPVPPPAVEWADQFEVWVGRRGDPAAPSSRWCYLDLSINDGVPSGRAWRPGHTLRCVSVQPTRVQTLLVVLEWQPPDDPEQAGRVAREEQARRGPGAEPVAVAELPVSERWTVEARLVQQDDGARVEGQATIERTQGDATRSWTAPFAGTRAEANEEQATFDHDNAPAPPPRLIDERTHE